MILAGFSYLRLSLIVFHFQFDKKYVGLRIALSLKKPIVKEISRATVCNRCKNYPIGVCFLVLVGSYIISCTLRARITIKITVRRVQGRAGINGR